ncbi:MAG: cyclic nucleotide-binding domain-containing protein, partial [Chloroflexota bacterium]|nr:cyclic nucleotide-binding domain-containing protein [Chloroflexota bacterium]
GAVDSTLTLANLSAGSLAGEEDLLLDRPYSTSARAATTTQLFVLSRTDLEDLVGQHPTIGLKFSAALGLRISFLEQYLVQQRLRNIELLSALSEDDLRAIAQKLDFHSVARGDLIVQASAPGDTAYFVEEGQARQISQSSEGDHFEELDEGSLFGHTALLTGKPYAATVRAVTDVSLWALSRDAYRQLIAERPAIKLAFSRALAESLSASDQTEAMERMRTLHLFSDMPTEGLAALTARLVLRHFPVEEAIYTEGTPGDAMYIVESGEVKLLDTAFSDAHLLERMRSGDSFGEMALLTGRTRAECARAASDTTLWVLYKSDFDDVMVQYPEISVSLSRALTQRLASRESDFVVRHLRRIDLFVNLAASELQTISKKVRGLRFRPGEIICFAGQPAAMLYLIEMGEVKRIAAGPNGEPITLDILGPGESIGIQALVQNAPHQATSQAIGEVELWTIDKPDFVSMMETYPTLAITVTRMMAERLTRAQQAPPAMRGPRGGIPAPTRGPSGTPRPPRTAGVVPPRPPAPRANANVPPPPSAKIRQPLSGARPIKPALKNPAAPTIRKTSAASIVPPTPQTPAAAVKPGTTSTAPKPKTPSGSHLPHLPHVEPPHIPTPHLPHVQAPHIPAPHLPHVEPPHIPTPHLPHVQAPHIPAPHLPHVQAPHIPAPHLPHVQAPHLPAPHLPRVQAPHVPNVAGGASRFINEFGAWVIGLSLGAKVRVLVSGALLMYILFIAFPVTTVDTVSSAVAGLSLSNQKSAPPVQLVRNPATGTGKLKVAYAVNTATPFPTRTPAPTSTPKPKPTAAPVKREPTAAPVIAAAPIAAPAALPPLLAAIIDRRLGPGGLDKLQNVRVIAATAASGQKFWHITRIDFEDGPSASSGCGDHNIKVNVRDESGKRVFGTKLLILGGDPSPWYEPEKSQADAEIMCGFNFSYTTGGGEYTTSLEDQYPSDKATGLKGLPEKQHVSYVIVFQLTTMP